MRRVNINKTQILHRIRLKQFVPNTPLQNNYSGEKLQPDEETVIPQDDLYTISWVADFDYKLFETRKYNWPDSDKRLPNDASSGEVDDYVTEGESSSVKENGRNSEIKNDNDVSENEIRPRPASSSDATSTISKSPSWTENENDVTNELNDDVNVSTRGADTNVHGISENEKSEENSSPRGGKYNLRPNPTPNYSDEYRF